MISTRFQVILKPGLEDAIIKLAQRTGKSHSALLAEAFAAYINTKEQLALLTGKEAAKK